MLCGDGCPAFAREDVIRFTEPKLGYSRDSPAFEKSVNVLAGLQNQGEERLPAVRHRLL